ncbi:MAG TPA: hypothetical protein VG709_01545 [Actinomycetota bacterium]|nr:hypothetical protein [Actinomycetota bacterium]
MDTERVEGPAPAPTIARIIMLVLAGALLIFGSFLTWIGLGQLGDVAAQLGQELPSTAGVNLEFSIYYSATQDPTGGGEVNIFSSAGLVTIAAGGLALLGLLIPWLARLGGAIGVIAFVAFVITLYRVEDQPGFSFGIGNVGIGMWMVLAGSILALIGGFLVARRTVVTSTAAAEPPPEP